MNHGAARNAAHRADGRTGGKPPARVIIIIIIIDKHACVRERMRACVVCPYTKS